MPATNTCFWRNVAARNECLLSRGTWGSRGRWVSTGFVRLAHCRVLIRDFHSCQKIFILVAFRFQKRNQGLEYSLWCPRKKRRVEQKCQQVCRAGGIRAGEIHMTGLIQIGFHIPCLYMGILWLFYWWQYIFLDKIVEMHRNTFQMLGN